jgi:uncharacterized protein (DUF2252 family)
MNPTKTAPASTKKTAAARTKKTAAARTKKTTDAKATKTIAAKTKKATPAKAKKTTDARAKKTIAAKTKKATSAKKTSDAKALKTAGATTKRSAAGETKLTAALSDNREARAAAGESLRRQVPLEAHAQLDGRASNSDPVELLEQQAADRVPELIPIRYGRMLVSPFTFYRGAALIMATDLAQGPRTDLTAQICGDAHLSNFGVFASPERQLVFDLNDFDETHPGPFEWDVKRLAASLEIAGRDNEFSRKKRRQVVLTAVESYRLAMQDFASQTNFDVWYAHLAIQPGMPALSSVQSKATRRSLRADLEKARTRDSLGSLKKMTEPVGEELRFVSQPPLIVPARDLPLDEETSADLAGWMSNVLAEYSQTLPSDRRHLISQYKFVDIARKVVGVGSVGTRAWVLLMRGVDQGDPLILQAKEATASVLEGYTGASAFESHGQRVVEGQRLMQAYGDILLGWHHFPDGSRPDYYLRQLRDWKGSFDVAALDPQALAIYAKYCAWTLARAHARSGDRVAIAAYIDDKDAFDQAIADFSVAYADKNEQDFARLQGAASAGTIPVQHGV